MSLTWRSLDHVGDYDAAAGRLGARGALIASRDAKQQAAKTDRTTRAPRDASELVLV